MLRTLKGWEARRQMGGQEPPRACCALWQVSRCEAFHGLTFLRGKCDRPMGARYFFHHGKSNCECTTRVLRQVGPLRGRPSILPLGSVGLERLLAWRSPSEEGLAMPQLPCKITCWIGVGPSLVGPVVWKTAAGNVPQACHGSGWRSRIDPMCRAQAVPHQRPRPSHGQVVVPRAISGGMWARWGCRWRSGSLTGVS